MGTFIDRFLRHLIFQATDIFDFDLDAFTGVKLQPAR